MKFSVLKPKYVALILQTIAKPFRVFNNVESVFHKTFFIL